MLIIQVEEEECLMSSLLWCFHVYVVLMLEIVNQLLVFCYWNRSLARTLSYSKLRLQGYILVKFLFPCST